MTPTDKDRFLRTFNSLAVAYQARDIDAVTVGVYFRALEDLPVEAVEAGALELQRGSQRPTFFPTAVQWYEAARLQSQRLRERRLALPADVEDPLDDDAAEEAARVARFEALLTQIKAIAGTKGFPRSSHRCCHLRLVGGEDAAQHTGAGAPT